MSDDESADEHWDDAYRQGATTRSWYEPEASVSLAMLEACAIGPSDSVLDVGGGASTLVDGLVRRGFKDITVLDIAPEALQAASARLGEASGDVRWIRANLLTWDPDRHWSVWHDRALLHFFTDESDRRQYVEVLHNATAVGSHAVIATFSPHGPERCSGLPTRRYDVTDLETLLGPSWRVLASAVRDHRTPSGAVQQFTWAAFERTG